MKLDIQMSTGCDRQIFYNISDIKFKKKNNENQTWFENLDYCKILKRFKKKT